MGLGENMKKHMVFISGLSDCISRHRIICITRSMKRKQATPLSSECLNTYVMIASYASAGCNCIACHGDICKLASLATHKKCTISRGSNAACKMQVRNS